MFKEEREYTNFKWEDLGNIEVGRPNLGQSVPVVVYRLLQYTFRDVMISEIGVDKTNDIIVKAGRLAGFQFCKNMLNKQLGFNEFAAELQRILKEQSIGILRIEKVDLQKMRMILAVAEDLDCSGLPISEEVVCHYDEGFISGILESYTGKPFLVKEVDCWANGDRVCRFEIKLSEDKDD